MAMTMADNVIRKACDRCHTQKLSCKRVGEEPCERCTRLKTECKSSPSLRYKKQQQQQQQQQQNQQQAQQQYQQQQQKQQQQLAQVSQQYQRQTHHHHPQQQLIQSQPQQQHQTGPPPVPSAETVHIRSRSPKRRRTDSDPSLVVPEAGRCPPNSLYPCLACRPPTHNGAEVPIVSHAEGHSGKTHPAVTPETVLDISDFNFNFDQLGFFAPAQVEHLSQPGIPTRLDDFNPHQGIFADPWDHHQPLIPSSSSVYSTVTPNSLPQTDLNSSPRVVPSVPLRRRSGVPEHGVSDKRIQHRSRQRPRQIALRQSALRPQAIEAEVASVHWMAQLNDINTRLLDLASALPQQQETARNGAPLRRPADERFKENGFPIDEMFQLTRRVADILDHFSASSHGKEPSKARRSLLDGSDPANSMLVLSTYVRLLDMYQRVFTLVSTELTQADTDATFMFWKLPDVSVGSFAVESSPFLQMSLTIQLAEEFLGRLRNATTTLDTSLRNGGTDGQQAGGAGGGSMFSGVVDVSYQAVKSREENLGKHLAELRSEIEALLET